MSRRDEPSDAEPSRRERRAREELDRRKEALLRELARATRTLRRRLDAVRGDLARSAQVPELRRDAGLLLSHLHALARGQVELRVVDETSDPPTPRTLAIDPALGPKRQADAWFARARKLERGAAIASTRARDTEQRLARVEELRARLAGASEPTALDDLERAATQLGLLATGPVRTAGRAPAGTRLPYREFLGTGARRILVGKSAADNDRLTLDHARPHDLWLHARDVSGSHVVVPLTKGEACPPALLADAATLAAHFSQARGERVADVIHVARRYVRKPRKAPVGQVTVEREKVLRLDLEPARLARMLASERGRV